MRWTLRRLVVVYAILAIALLGISSTLAFHAADASRTATSRMELAMQVLHNHMEADMMHDAVRADVLNALRAAEHERDAQAAILEEMKQHADDFRTALVHNQALQLTPAITAALARVTPTLDGYNKSAETLGALAFADPAAAHAKLPDFLAVFHQLEVQNDNLTELIEKEVEATQAEAASAAHVASTTVVVVGIIGAAIALAVALLVRRRIARDVDRVLVAARAAGAGDLRASDGEPAGNELGDIARELGRAMTGMREALASDRVDWAEVGKQRAEIARVSQLVDRSPLQLVAADRELAITYRNPAAVALFARLGIVGRIGDSVSAQHAELAARAADLVDPARLPLTCRIEIGDEVVDVRAVAINAVDGAFQGPMLTWQVVTDVVHAERREAEHREAEERHRREAAAARELEERRIAAAAREASEAREQVAAAEAEAERVRAAEAHAHAEAERARSEELQRKVDAILAVVDAAARGDLTGRISVRGADAIGRLGEGLSRFLASLRDSIAHMATTATGVTEVSAQLTAAGRQLGTNATTASTETDLVAARASEVSRSVGDVAHSIGELEASVREIAANTARAASVATEAVQLAEDAGSTMKELGDSSVKIESVVQTITAIARQTNLLALNATIEAARAGDAGKGFAVVANEVKELAKQTGAATEDIVTRIAAIRKSSGDAVVAIRSIEKIVAQINETQTTIASAVEEQSAVTATIARTVGQTAGHVDDIARGFGTIAGAARATSEGARENLAAATRLDRTADDLRTVVSRFRVDTRGTAPEDADADPTHARRSTRVVPPRSYSQRIEKIRA